MDETNITEQQTANQPDPFLDGWDDEPEMESAADQQGVTEEGSAATEEGGNTEPTEQDAGATEDGDSTTEATEATAGSDGAGDTTTQTEQQSAAAPSWVIKHMGSEETLTAKDITPELLQKGRDYDRIRGKYDEAKPLIELFSAEAAKRGITIADYAKLLRTESKKAEGMSEAEAKRAVELEDREAAVSAKEAQQTESTRAEEANAQRIRAELEDFARAFPEAYNKAASDPESIPQSVYDDWKSGMSLTAAYAKHTVAEANAAAAAAQQRATTADKNAQNTSRSTGSMQSAGSDTKQQDAFLAGFND